MQTFRVVILDDLGQPILEGPEKFELVLRMPMNGILGEPSKATILINDTVSDCKSKKTQQQSKVAWIGCSHGCSWISFLSLQCPKCNSAML